MDELLANISAKIMDWAEQIQRITIKEVDKWSAVVLINTVYYIALVLSILEDTTYYVKVQHHSKQKIMRNLKTILNSFTEGLTGKKYDYMNNFKSKPCQFYNISIIHKSDKISNTCRIATDIIIKGPSSNNLK